MVLVCGWSRGHPGLRFSSSCEFPKCSCWGVLVGATPLHLLSQTALPLKSSTGAFIASLRFANAVPPQTLPGTCTTNWNLSGQGPSICSRRPFGHLKAPLGLSLFRFAPQTRIFYFFVLGAISSMTVTRIYKPYSNQVMVLFQGKLISGWFNANTINAIAIISIIKPRILDIRFFMQSTSLSNWNLAISNFFDVSVH